MRDNHRGMIEFLSAGRQGAFYYVDLMLPDDKKSICRILLRERSYKIVRKIMQKRIFDMMPGLHYRYFYIRSTGYSRRVHIRTEVLRDGGSFYVKSTVELILKLTWLVKYSHEKQTEKLLRRQEHPSAYGMVLDQAGWNLDLFWQYFKFRYLGSIYN